MALTEQERKLLEQLEASLAADDPKLASTLRGNTQRKVHRKRATLAGLGFVAGLTVLVLGMQFHPAVSVVGFLLMLASAIIALNSWQHVEAEAPSTKRPRKPYSSQDFMEKMEERWRKRQGF